MHNSKRLTSNKGVSYMSISPSIYTRTGQVLTNDKGTYYYYKLFNELSIDTYSRRSNKSKGYTPLYPHSLIESEALLHDCYYIYNVSNIPCNQLMGSFFCSQK